ncbi:uncharacterized protein STEHIDRAFT_160212 [Stereum hirsutum FP-91666 SS1]|uniref:uncharacterized protein n=1 Tax=Stereum hirsutum (strain FP-91666) TaxID=721885 RepID=UPI0004449F26|nr:uncharacterized protein STEHIDRAFT_160212 [Stereum hirsutum FP-91666 SS1]EIM83637.1 hypothetical protein STEHIDRAFT_160212 [Stereum hirsutum FP-91666 SS1]
MAVKPQQFIDLGNTPKKKTNGEKCKRSESTISDESEGFRGSVASAISDGDTTDSGVVDESIPRTKKAARPSTDASSHHPVVQGSDASGSEVFCSICNTIHCGPCNMTDNPENLAAYRLALLTRADNEPIEEKREAITLIETVLRDHGKLHLIDGQPLHLVERPPPAAVSVKQSNETSILHALPSAQPPVAPAASFSRSAPGKRVSARDGSSSSSAAARLAPSFMSRFRIDLSVKPSKPKPKPKPARLEALQQTSPIYA